MDAAALTAWSEEARRAAARVRERSIGPDTPRHLAELLTQATVYVGALLASETALASTLATLREEHHNTREQLGRALMFAERDGMYALVARGLVQEQLDAARAELAAIGRRSWWEWRGCRASAREGLRRSYGSDSENPPVF